LEEHVLLPPVLCEPELLLLEPEPLGFELLLELELEPDDDEPPGIEDAPTFAGAIDEVGLAAPTAVEAPKTCGMEIVGMEIVGIEMLGIEILGIPPTTLVVVGTGA